MIDDPIVAEVRRIREEHAAKFGYDLKAICEDLKRRQATSGRKYVNFPPRWVSRPDAAGEDAATSAVSDVTK